MDEQRNSVVGGEEPNNSIWGARVEENEKRLLGPTSKIVMANTQLKVHKFLVHNHCLCLRYGSSEFACVWFSTHP